MSADARNVLGLNFDPDDPSLLCEELGFPVRLQGTTTPAKTPHPGTDYPGPEPEPPEDREDAARDPALSAAGYPRRGRQKLIPLDIDV